VINELDVSVSVLDYDGDGSLTFRQTIPLASREEVSKSDSIGADIQVLPNGKYVYASVRGLDSLAILKVEPTGSLSLQKTVSSAGKTPRNFAISPDARYLLVANQDTDNVVVFKIDPNTAQLNEISQIHVPTPVCIRMYVHS
jgi:6-phosphogluconolactonase